MLHNDYHISLWVLWQSRVPRLSLTLDLRTHQVDIAGRITKYWKVMSRIHMLNKCFIFVAREIDTERQSNDMTG